VTEALVQEVFVQFRLARTHLAEIENKKRLRATANSDTYLFRLTHFSRRARSVLILGFFLDYFLTEITTVLGPHCWRDS
jgi:hypothetical protein